MGRLIDADKLLEETRKDRDYAEKHGFKYKVVDILEGEEAGISSATLEISGKMAYGNLRGEN